MNKLLKYTFMLLCCFLLMGCLPLDKETDKKSIVCTTYAQYNWLQEIIGENNSTFELTLLIKDGADLHSYQPTIQDLAKVSSADLFVYVGGESEQWVSDALKEAKNKNMLVVDMMDVLKERIKEEEHVEGMKEDHDENEDESEYDEHVWTSPRNAIKIVDKINSSMAESRPVNKEIYNNNTISYNEKLEQLDKDFHEIVKSGKRNTIVFGDRFPFRYFADEYGLEYYAAFPGCSEETEASAKTVSFLIDKIKTENIPVVLYPELSNQKVAKTICESTGAFSLQFNSCHNLTNDEFESGATYLSLMKENITTLKRALN